MEIQLTLTYIIVAIALVSREEVFIVCFGMQRKEKDAVVIAVAGEKVRIKKAACKSSFFILMLVSALVRNS